MSQEKPGRPRGTSRNNSEAHTQLTISLPVPLIREIEQMAAAENRSRTNMIDCLLREAVQGKELSRQS
jgi:metal-responsive CopG/Arc/MetJ family transcriptional regulator